MGDDKATKPTTKALNAVCGLFNSRLKRNLKNTESRLDKGSFRKIGPLNLLSIFLNFLVPLLAVGNIF